jgi:8-oxo-dGTP pyrophosphatase MutT (NUDIX family)
MTLAAMILPFSAGEHNAGRVIAKNDPWDYGVRLNSDGSVGFVTNNSQILKTAAGTVPFNVWSNVVITFDMSLPENQIKIYVNGVLKGVSNKTTPLSSTQSSVYIGNRADEIVGFDGLIDDVRIYNRSLTAIEVSALYVRGQEPDAQMFADYYNFVDPVTSDALLVDLISSPASVDNITLVTCTSFFTNNTLSFQANNSVSVNLWTNLGKPISTIGNCVWNSENYTTTILLDASVTADLHWGVYNITTYTDANSGITPFNVTVGYGVSQTFSFNASKGYRFNVAVDGVSQGQIDNYTFSNVTTPHTVNVTSIQIFAITASAGGNGSIAPSGLVVVDSGQSQRFNFTASNGFHISKILVNNVSQPVGDFYVFNNVTKNHVIDVSFEVNTYNITANSDAHSSISPSNISVVYGSVQSFNITSDPGYVAHVMVDGVDQGNLTSYEFSDVHENHSISVTSEALEPSGTVTTPSSSPGTSPSTFQPTGSPSPAPSSSLIISPTPTPVTSAGGFPTQIVLIAIAALVVIGVFFGVAFKKGYISIEPVNAEQPSESTFGEGRSKSKPDHGAATYPQFNNYQMEKLVTILASASNSSKDPPVSKACSLYVEGVYVLNEKILLLKRNVEPFKSYWHVVGGQVGLNESLQEALKREYLEETGLEIDVGKIICGRVEETMDRIKFIISLEVTSAKGEFKLNGENSESNWFGQLPLNVVFDYSKYLRKVV